MVYDDFDPYTEVNETLEIVDGYFDDDIFHNYGDYMWLDEGLDV